VPVGNRDSAASPSTVTNKTNAREMMKGSTSLKGFPSKVGKTVTGFVYVDTYNPKVSTGDEVVRIPYSYTIAP
jgi:hypothetical protein